MIMKKLYFFVLFLMSVAFSSAQIVIDGVFQYELKPLGKAKVGQAPGVNLTDVVTIPSSVEHGGTTYVVDEIGGIGFANSNLRGVIIPNTVEIIGNYAFANSKIQGISIPNTVRTIGDYAFRNCPNLSFIVLPEGIQTIGANAFDNSKLTNIEIPTTVTSIGANAFVNSASLKTINVKRITPPILGLGAFNNTTQDRKLIVPCGSLDAYKANDNWVSNFSSSNSQGIISECQTLTSVTSGNFNNPATWGISSMPTAPASYVIKSGNIVTLNQDFVLTSENTIINNGILEIAQSGQLINTTDNNVQGIIEVHSPAKQENKWTFIGAPFSGYSLKAIVPKDRDVSVSMFDYIVGDWSEEWETIETSVVRGEGYFLWPFANGSITYTTYGDGKYSHNAGSEYSAYSYDLSKSASYQLNNADFSVIKTVKEYPGTGGGNWMALSNPYPAKLSVADFLSDNSGKGIQGGCTYHFNGSTWEIKDAVSGDILMTDGFFVNFSSEGSKTIDFKKTQLTNYPSKKIKNNTASQYVELSLIDGDEKVKLYFSHNEKAEKEYDIFDANKMFAGSDIAEPYFVVNGKSLVKEAVNVLPYTANINVRTIQSKQMSFIVDNLPEGYTVFLLDNGQDIRLSEGLVYTTEFKAGENADRFQLLVKKNRQMDIEEDFDLKVVNENRNVEVISNENVVKVEVVNALGRNVFNTKQKQFTLSDVSSGMYFVKVYISKDSKRIYSKTKKIFIE